MLGLAALPVGESHVSALGEGSRVAVAQVVVVEVGSAAATTGTLRVIERSGDAEETILGPVSARLGRNGVRRLRREGDGTTPLGTMRITGAFGAISSPRVAVPYRRIERGDCWVSDVGDARYNELVRRARCSSPNEDLFRIASAGPYEYALTTDYNSSPVVVGKGSAIFIHVHAYDATGRTKPTSGCVSVSRSVMKRLFSLLDPAKNPTMVVRVRR
jgi:L,D-peptidoglycan transpeptidase YkuD (ErfK/YbiS/YcfS/YnhG family)